MLRSLVFFLVIWITATSSAIAGPAEEATAVVDRWAAAYSANDVDALVGLYTPTAILLGTTSPIVSEGTAGVREYFKDMPGSGRRNVVEDKRVIVLGDAAAVVTGFYNFFRPDQPGVPRPSRYTMVIVKTDGRWLIAHHHSSPRSATRQ